MPIRKLMILMDKKKINQIKFKDRDKNININNYSKDLNFKMNIINKKSQTAKFIIKDTFIQQIKMIILNSSGFL